MDANHRALALQFRLPEADNQAIFDQQIRPSLLLDSDESGALFEPPLCIVLAGQTGAGKSYVSQNLIKELSLLDGKNGESKKSTFCHIVADTQKVHHPQYKQLVEDTRSGKVPNGFASAACGPDARLWFRRSCELMADMRRPVFVESASRFPEDVNGILKSFREKHFRVCLVVLAVPGLVSRMGLLSRFWCPPATAIPSTPSAPQLPHRLTPAKIHNESYTGLKTLADMVDDAAQHDAALADLAILLRRGNKVAFWGPPDRNIGGALEKERRLLEKDEKDSLIAASQQLKKVNEEAASKVDSLMKELPEDSYETRAEGGLEKLDLADLLHRLGYHMAKA